MNDVRDVLSEFLISDKNTNKSGSTTTRQVLEATLMPYIGLPARDFVAVARKAVNALFDWAVRTQPNSINNSLKAALVGKESYVNQTMEFISSIKNNPEHPLYNNAVINSINLVGNDKSDIENLQIKGKDNKIFDQNSLIYGLREIKEFARSINKISLYGNIIRVGILQSGLENSKISFTSLVPYEDFQEIYKETLSNLENMPNLADFYNGGILERSQWNNTDIVGAKVSTLKKNKFGKWYTDYGMSQESIPESVKNKIAKKEIPPVLEIPMLSREARKDFIKYTWEDPNIKAAQKAEMRKQGDFSYRHTVLLKKVYQSPGNPLINYGKKGNFPKYVYKAVHALGDSYRATEALPVSYGSFSGTQAAPTRANAIMQASVLDNGFDKNFTETTDDVITNAYLGQFSGENIVPLPSMQQAQPSTSIDDNSKTSIEGLNQRLDSYGNAKVVLPNNFYEGDRPKGRLNAFKAGITKVADNIIVLADLNLNEFDFISEQDKKRLDALRPLAEEFRKINTNDISSAERRTVAVEKRYAQLSNQLTNEFVDIMGKYVEQQLGKKISSSQPTQSTSVQITKSNYTRQEVQNNPNTAYVFTENTHSITAFPNKVGGGSAIIRGLDNAYAIVTKKKYDYNTKENIDYTDTPENFKEFTEVNTKLIKELKNHEVFFKKIIFPQGFATDKAKMPTRFAEWLQKELLDNFGLVTELNSTKTGLISKSISQPTQAVNTESNVNEEKTNSGKTISELGMSQEEWNKLTIEEKNKIKSCN
jgi:hypothetical protein